MSAPEDFRDDGMAILREYGPLHPAPSHPVERITRKYAPDSGSSMIVTGTYADGVTKEEVEKLVSGTFGGRFESFGGGHYRYIAYTD